VDHRDHNPPWCTRSVQDHLGPRSDISLMYVTRCGYVPKGTRIKNKTIKIHDPFRPLRYKEITLGNFLTAQDPSLYGLEKLLTSLTTSGVCNVGLCEIVHHFVSKTKETRLLYKGSLASPRHHCQTLFPPLPNLVPDPGRLGIRAFPLPIESSLN